MSKRWAAFTTAAVVPALVLATQLPGAAEGPATAGTTPQVHFNAVGDFSTGSNAAAVLDQIATLDADLTVALGDLSYGATGQEQSWCDFVTSHVGEGYPFELIAGNHESNKANGYINDFATCLPNQVPGARGTYGRQYFMDVPQGAPLVRFIQISPGLTFPDGAYSYAAGSPRYAWTAAAIDSARTANIPWVVVSMHKPCLSVGAYPCDPGSDLFNMLIDKRVDLVLTGHDHSYQRSKQLALGVGCTSIVPGTYDADCVSDSDASLKQGRGTVLAVVGTGGNSLYGVDPADTEADFFAATSGANKQPTWGVLDVSADADALHARFVPAAGAMFTDAFDISRSTTPNAPPTAAFTSACTGGSCTFDGSSSVDSDGTIASYSWDFGDGATGTGPTPTHVFAAGGDFTTRLTVTDDGGSTDTVTKTVTVSVPNQAPTARFTSSSAGLVTSFDAEGSTDSDGSISTYAWDFGDGTTASVKAPTHTYGSAGAFPVTLTVTDDDGAIDSLTKTVTVTNVVPPIAADSFSRSLAGAWGSSDTGGAWTLAGVTSAFSVDGGKGVVTTAQGKGYSASLNGVSSTSTDTNVSVSIDRTPASGSGYVQVIGRGTNRDGYSLKLMLTTAGKLNAFLVRAVTGTETNLASRTVLNTYTPNTVLRVRVVVTATNPTQLRAKVWTDGTPEPTAWQMEGSDTAASLQASRPVALYTYQSAGATNPAISVLFDDYTVKRAE